MSLVERSAIHEQVADSNSWQVTIPSGGSMGRPEAAYDSDGNSIDWDSWDYINGVLHVNFGIDMNAGKLLYKYFSEGSECSTTSVCSDGGVVNVTVNQFPRV
ncbi:MAG: hypothetical protein ACRCSS_20575 [Shewanella sp.]